MLAINALLHLLNIFTVVMHLVWLLLAMVEIAWLFTSPLRNTVVRSHEAVFRSRSPPGYTKTQKPPPIVLFTPTSPLYYLIYSTIAPQLLHIPADNRALLLRGRRFMVLAQSIISGTPSPLITKLDVKLPPQGRLQYLVSLPDMIVTPPEDGNRLPLAGEKGGPRVKDLAEGFLAPPRKGGRLGKQVAKKKKQSDKKEDEGAREEKEKASKKKICQEK